VECTRGSLVLVGKAKATHNLVPDGASAEADDGWAACAAPVVPVLSRPGDPLADLAGGRAS
jgi:hypothetical protein